MKYVYLFGNGEADGTAEMKNLLGGKGANLAEMNHSDRFWRVVEELYGPWKAQRHWLRQNGPRLHGYRFDD